MLLTDEYCTVVQQALEPLMSPCYVLQNVAMQDYAKKQEYKLGNRTLHADDQAVAQYYIALYERNGGDEVIAPTQTSFDTVLSTAPNVSLLYDPQGVTSCLCRHTCD